VKQEQAKIKSAPAKIGGENRCIEAFGSHESVLAFFVHLKAFSANLY